MCLGLPLHTFSNSEQKTSNQPVHSGLKWGGQVGDSTYLALWWGIRLGYLESRLDLALVAVVSVGANQRLFKVVSH